MIRTSRNPANSNVDFEAFIPPHAFTGRNHAMLNSVEVNILLGRIMQKSHIITEIQRLAAANSGAAPGWRKLQKEAGINYSDWCGVHWARWNDALADAGFAPNRLTEAYSDLVLLDRYAALAVELGHLPTGADLRLKTQSDHSFPSDKTFGRLGSKLNTTS